MTWQTATTSQTSPPSAPLALPWASRSRLGKPSVSLLLRSGAASLTSRCTSAMPALSWVTTPPSS
eukprot:11159954-Lingulodinium_polyedra.AAC.1